MIIYQLTNRINGKSYIGQTVNSLETRVRSHCQKRSGCVALYHAITKYGIENFEQKILVQADSIEELNYYEEALIASLQTLVPSGYNLLYGGNNRRQTEAVKEKRNKTLSDPVVRLTMGSGNRGRVRTQSERQNISNALKGRTFSDEHRANLSKSSTGRKMPPVTDAQRQKLSEASQKMWETRSHVGTPHTAEAKEKIRAASTGRIVNDETKAKISATRIEKGIRHTPEVLARIGAKLKGREGPMRGKTHSEESRKKISAAGRGRVQSAETRQKKSDASKRMWALRKSKGAIL